MVKVELPRASWESVLVCLQELREQGWIVQDLIDDIDNQVYSQEY